MYGILSRVGGRWARNKETKAILAWSSSKEAVDYGFEVLGLKDFIVDPIPPLDDEIEMMSAPAVEDEIDEENEDVFGSSTE